VENFYWISPSNTVLKSCNPCNEVCLDCNQETHECLSCDGRYKLRNGICYLSYSIKAKYYVDFSSKDVKIIGPNFGKK